jgi:Tol biopolymer transport system component
MRFSCSLLIALFALSWGCPAEELADDPSAGGWQPSNAKAPATVEVRNGALVLADKPGGEVTWGTSCAKRFESVDLARTPYLVFRVVSLTGGFSAKLAGDKSRPKKSVASGTQPGLVVVDIPRATGWPVEAGTLTVMLYAQGDGTQVTYGPLRFTDTLAPDEQAALRTERQAKPGLAAPKFAGLTALAARRGPKPSVCDPATGERSVYTDPVTKHTVWRVTDDPAVERHVYYDTPAWNANGSVLHWVSRRAGGSLWLMNADGTQFRPVPAAQDGGPVKSPHWSPTDPNRMYFARTDEAETAVYALDIRDGSVAKVVAVPLPAVIGERRFNEFPPPHPDGRHFLLRWGGQDRHPSLLVVVDAETGQVTKLEAGTPTHRVRFTKAPDCSVFINTNDDPDHPGQKLRVEWVMTLDGRKHRLPPVGGHPDWSPDGKWVAGYKYDGIRLISRDGQTDRELVHVGAGGHGGFSIATGQWHVGDSPRRGPYADLVYVTELATGKVTPIAYHGSSYSGWGSGVPDPEATHPSPVCSPDETKIVYDSDLLGQPDVWVAVWQLPDAPRTVRFAAGTLSWETPVKHRETAGYAIYRQEGDNWLPTGDLVAGTQTAGLAAGTYAVAAREWSGLESPLAVANGEELATDHLAPTRPGAPRVAQTALSHLVLELPECRAGGFSHYNVYAAEDTKAEPSAATLVGSPRARRFVDWGLQPGMVRHYRATVVDWQGNESPPSAAVVGRTEGTPMQPVRVEIEAEDGAIEAPMRVGHDAAASGGAFVHVPTDYTDDAYVLKGSVAFDFEVAQDGIYSIWGRVMGLDGRSNSFRVEFDGGEEAVWNIPVPRQGKPAFAWQLVPGLHGTTLRKGKHRLVLRSREDGSRIDRLTLTSDYDFVPRD